MPPNNLVRRHFLPALRRAGLKRIRFHDLRHTHNTHLYQKLPELGISYHYIAQTHGHASAKMSFDQYGHAMRPTSDIGDKIEAAILGKSVRKMLEKRI